MGIKLANWFTGIGELGHLSENFEKIFSMPKKNSPQDRVTLFRAVLGNSKILFLFFFFFFCALLHFCFLSLFFCCVSNKL